MSGNGNKNNGVKHTLMVYMAADNNLGNDAAANLEQLREGMILAGYPENVEVYVLFDNAARGEHYILKMSGSAEEKIKLAGNPDTGSTETLAGFVDYVKADADPASIFSLVMWNHGEGLGGAMSDDISGNKMSLAEISATIAGRGIDVVGFDACLMACAEFVVELEGSGVNYLVAAEELEGASGWNYSNIVSYLASATSVRQAADAMMDAAMSNPEANKTMSILDVTRAAQLAGAMNDFAEAAIMLDSNSFLKLVSSVNSAIWLGNWSPLDRISTQYYVSTDLVDFLNCVVSQFSANDPITKAAKNLIAALNLVVVDNYAPGFYSQGSGISAFLPTSLQSFYNYVDDLENTSIGVRKGAWTLFVQQMSGQLVDDNRYVRFVDTGLEGALLGNGSVALELGVFNGGGTVYRRQSLFQEKTMQYLLQVKNAPGADGGIVIKAANRDSTISYSLVDRNSGRVVTSGSQQGSLTISGSYLTSGDYLIQLNTDASTYFTLSYEANWNSGVDHLEVSGNNNTMANAYVCSPGYYTGLLTSANDPDWYKLPVNTAVCDSFTVSGDAVTLSSLTVLIYDKNGNRTGYTYWDSGRKVFSATLTEAAVYIKVQGTSNQVIGYDLNISVRDYGESPYTFADTISASSSSVVYNGRNGLVIETAGIYSLTIDNFECQGITVKISVINASGKTVASGAYKNGALTFKNALLTAGNYTVRVDKTSKNISGSYNFTFNEVLLFNKANEYNDDNWLTIYRYGNTKNNSQNVPATVAVTEWESANKSVNGKLLYSEWVGFGDEIDYRMLDVEHHGKYTFAVNTTDAVQVTLYSVQGGSLKKIKTANIKYTGSASTTVNVFSGVFLTKGNYFISVKSTNAAKGGSADYSVIQSGASIMYTNGNNADDNWKSLGADYRIAYDNTSSSVIANEWVGFGDEVDYRQMKVTTSGTYNFTISANGKVKAGIYVVGANGSLKAVSSVSLNGGAKGFGSVIMDASNTYYIMVQCTDAKKGGQASYNLNSSTASNNLCLTIDTAKNADSSLELAARSGQTANVNFNLDSVQTLVFNGFNDSFSLKLYTFDAKTNKKKAVAIKDGVSSKAISGSCYLELTSAGSNQGLLTYDAASRSLDWLACGTVAYEEALLKKQSFAQLA